MIEEWKVYKDTRGKCNGCLYEVSNYGRLKKNGIIVEPFIDKSSNRVHVYGYNRMHRVVYELFVGKIPQGYVIDHIDTNPLNNRVDNLRCCTQKENCNNPLTVQHHNAAMKLRSNEEYSLMMKEQLKEHRRSYKGSGNPMYGKKRHREYNEDGTYHYIFD